MKAPFLLFALALLAGCSSPSSDTPPPAAATPSPAPATATEPMAAMPAAAASANGVVDAVDPAAKTITISHGPVESLKWPAMTMTFKAPNTDLSAIKPGDQVDFEFTATGMDGTITTITRK